MLARPLKVEADKAGKHKQGMRQKASSSTLTTKSFVAQGVPCPCQQTRSSLRAISQKVLSQQNA